MAAGPVPQRAGQWRAALYPGECCGSARVAWLCVEPRSAGAEAEGLRRAPRLAPAQRRAARPPSGPAEVSAWKRGRRAAERGAAGCPRLALFPPRPGGRAAPPGPGGGRRGGAGLGVCCAAAAAGAALSLGRPLSASESLGRGGRVGSRRDAESCDGGEAAVGRPVPGCAASGHLCRRGEEGEGGGGGGRAIGGRSAAGLTGRRANFIPRGGIARRGADGGPGAAREGTAHRPPRRWRRRRPRGRAGRGVGCLRVFRQSSAMRPGRRRPRPRGAARSGRG